VGRLRRNGCSRVPLQIVDCQVWHSNARWQQRSYGLLNGNWYHTFTSPGLLEPFHGLLLATEVAPAELTPTLETPALPGDTLRRCINGLAKPLAMLGLPAGLATGPASIGTGGAESLYGRPESLYGRPESLYGRPESLYGSP